MADSTLSNLTSLTLPSQATDLLLVGRGTARPNKVAMSDALNSAALAATTSAYGVAQLAADGGTTAGTVVQATDARLSNARNPPDGSKGDIIVSGSGSTWTIKTDPTLSGNVTVTGGTVTGGGGPLTLAASGSNQSVTLTPTGAATAGSLVVSRLTSTNQTLALLNYGTDELMSVVGTGYTGVGSKSNTGFLLYSNNTERARFLAGGNFLIGKTIDNTLGRLQVSGAITMEEAAGTGLFGFFGGSTLVYGTLASNPVVIRTNNTAALTFDTSQNATFAKGLTTNGDNATHITFVRNGTLTIGPDATATPSLVVSAGIAASGTVSANIVRVGDGTAAAPSLSFTNDSDTGFYKVAAATDIVYFAAGGQPSLRLVTSGYLYSGSINSYLQLAPTGAINLVADVTTNQNVSLSASGTGAVVLNGTNILFRSQSGASEWARFNNSGTLLIATGVDSANGKIQLATHTASTGGIGFGTDIALYRRGTSSVRLEGTVTGTQFEVHDGARGFGFITSGGNDVMLTSVNNAANGFYIRAHNGLLALQSNSTTAFVLDVTQSGRLYGNYLYIGGGASNFHIRNTGSDNGLIRGNFLSADFASGFLLRNDTGTTEYVRVENPSGAVLLGTSTNSANGRLQLATHTASTGGIGFGTDVTLYRFAADILKTDDSFQALNNADTYFQVGAAAPYQRAAIGLTRRLNYGDVLFARNLQGQSGTDSYTAIGTDTGSGYAGFEAQYGGVARILLGTGATTANAVVTPTVALSASTSTVSIPLSTVSNSTSSGALVVSGGVGIAGNTYIGGNLVVTGTISPSSGGATNIWIPASQWIPRTTTGCGVDSTETTTNRQNFDELLFDPATAEYAQALVRLPNNYNNGTVTARFYWSASTSTGSVVWGIQARAFADDDALDTAFGTAQTVTDTLLATGDMHISSATSAMTSGGTPAATTPLQFQIYRDATSGSDTLGSDARLLGVEIIFN